MESSLCIPFTEALLHHLLGSWAEEHENRAVITPQRKKGLLVVWNRALASFPVWPGGFTARKGGVLQPGPWVTSSTKCWFCLCCRSSLASLFEVSGRSRATSLSLSRQTHPWPAFTSGLCGPRPAPWIPTLTGNAQGSFPAGTTGTSSQALFRCPRSAVQVGSWALSGSCRLIPAVTLTFQSFLMCPLLTSLPPNSNIPGPPLLLAASSTHLLRIPACCSHWGPDHSCLTLLHSQQPCLQLPSLALPQPYVLRLQGFSLREKTQLWGRRDPSRKIYFTNISFTKQVHFVRQLPL